MINPWNFTDPSSTYIQIHFACILIYHIDILYIHICIYIYIYICMYVCMHVCMYVCMYVYTHYLIYIYINVYNIYICIYISGAVLREVLWWMSTSGASPWPARASRGSGRAVQHHIRVRDTSSGTMSMWPGIKELRVGHEQMKLQVIVYIHILLYIYIYISYITIFKYWKQI